MFQTNHALVVLLALFATTITPTSSANSIATTTVTKKVNDEIKEQVNHLRHGTVVSTLSKKHPDLVEATRIAGFAQNTPVAAHETIPEDVFPVSKRLNLSEVMSMFFLFGDEKEGDNTDDEIANLWKKAMVAIDDVSRDRAVGKNNKAAASYLSETLGLDRSRNDVNSLKEAFASNSNHNKQQEESSLSSDHSGISFDRTFEYVHTSVTGLGLFFGSDDEGFCEELDEFGDTNCHFDWEDVVSVKVEGELAEDLDEGDRMEADLKINKFIKFKFSCAVCGQDCTVKVPIIDETITIKSPSCPINKNLANSWTLQLPDSGIGIHTNIKGTIKLVTKNDDKLIEVYTNIDVD